MGLNDRTPEADNMLSAADSFYERLLYNNNGFPIIDGIPEPLDLWNNKYALYGRIDHKGRAVVPKQQFISFIEDTEVEAFNFLVKAWSDMRSFIKRKQLSGNIPVNKRYDIKPVSGYYNHRQEYLAQSQLHYIRFIVERLMNSKIISFNEFEKEWRDFAKEELIHLKFTESSYVCTSVYTVMSTGLAISMHDSDMSKDLEKYKLFLEDLTFIEFQSIAAMFGFLVDRRHPSRLIANITNPVMLKYAGVTSPTEFFEKYYTLVSSRELLNVKNIITSFYKQFVEAFPNADFNKIGGSTKGKSLQALSKTVRREHIVPSFNDKHWLKLFLYIRICETGRLKKDLTKELNTAIILHERFGLDRSLEYISTL